MTADRYQRIFAVVRRIPRGRVATYGQIAELAGFEGRARQVGYALHSLKDDSVPWHRVINARGEISPRSAGDSHELQRRLLEAEGVEFDVTGRIALPLFLWRTRARRRHHAEIPHRSPVRPSPRRLRRQSDDGEDR